MKNCFHSLPAYTAYMCLLKINYKAFVSFLFLCQVVVNASRIFKCLVVHLS